MIPQPFWDRMKNMLGEEFQEFQNSFAEEKYQALRLNTLKMGHVSTSFRLTPVPWAENGFYYEKEDFPGKHPFHEAGVYYIQEPSAMAPVGLLQAEPGQRVLDLCAAPGGKSTQIAAFLQGKGLLVCNEIHPVRAKILSENIERMGVRNACVTNETPAALARIFPGYFDKILVDAPCSGEGMFRKNEEACAEWSPENVELCAARQDEILDCAAKMLRPGGRLVYSTCTFAPLENEGSISRFLERNSDFCLLEARLPGIAQSEQEGCRGRAEWLDRPAKHLQYTLRLWPHKIKGEGHFAALLQREGEAPNGYRAVSTSGLEGGLSEKELGEWRAFQKKFLRTDLDESLDGTYLKFGENLYLAPKEMPGLKGIKVLRPGLHLGTLKKNRFEPSHALALALKPKDAVFVWNRRPDEEEIRAYLRGETFAASGEKGWYLICVDGFSLGWGKLAGGIMKNHYPKGLRKY